MRAVAVAFLVTAFAVSLNLASGPPAKAFGDYGDITICETAYRMLTDTARKEVNRLLVADGEYKAFNRACTDPDHPRRRDQEHFLNLPRTTLSVTGADCFANPKCVVSAISADFAVLRSTTAADKAKAAALKDLGHWVGDVHQPLHVSYSDDRGGNHVVAHGPCAADNLHSVWDSCILDDGIFKFSLLERTLGWGKFTKAYRATDQLLPAITLAQRRAWQTSEPWQWAAESYAITIRPDVSYCQIKAGACWYDTDRQVKAPDAAKKKVMVDQAYLTLQTPVLSERMSQAAVRLAHLLNTAFDPAYTPT